MKAGKRKITGQVEKEDEDDEDEAMALNRDGANSFIESFSGSVGLSEVRQPLLARIRKRLN